MLKRRHIFTVLLLLSSLLISAQDGGTVKGQVIDAKTRNGLPFVNVIIAGTSIGNLTDQDGNFTISNVPLGYVEVLASMLGYEEKQSESYLVTNDRAPHIIIELTETSEQLDEVLVRTKLFKKNQETPISYLTLGINEIEKNPGGNRDVLKVIQSLPGVASNPGFRNDIIIRGGAPSEVKFYLDGIEVPVINHFQTQGATGGPVGMINADLIRNVDFLSSVFPADRGNALSSVISFTQKDGDPDKLNFRGTLGISDAGITADGPLSANTTFIASLRQSYLKTLFKALKLPFLPTYNDMQFKLKKSLNSSTTLTLVGLGALDNFELNEAVNEKVTDPDDFKRNRYILNNIPIQEQWNYTIGATLKHFGSSGNQLYVLSRNVWSNDAVKYSGNTGNINDLLLNYSSKEIENKFRYENNLIKFKLVNFKFGAGLENAKYTNATFLKNANINGVYTTDFSSSLSLFKFGLFSSIVSKNSNSKLGWSAGIRMDGTNYSSSMKNPFNQLSPRISINYLLSNKWRAVLGSGIYYQLPAYTIMGYRNESDELINKTNNLKYIRSSHIVGGLEFQPIEKIKFSLEGFYKKYSNYPFSVRDQISLANLGSDFGIIGNEEVMSISKGKAYGLEFLAQKKSYSGIYGILAYTFVKSKFNDKREMEIPSAWDNQHLLSLTAGKKLARNWELGVKYRFTGGRPYTPYDMEASSLIQNYSVSNAGILNYDGLNSLRYSGYNQLDIRLDKTWFLKRFSINLYIDVQNLLGSESQEQPLLLPVLDPQGNRVIDPSDNSRYVLEEIDNSSGTLLPGFGIIVDF